MTGIPFLDDFVYGMVTTAGVWFVFEIGLSWFRGGQRASTDVQDDF